jgi:DNA-binding response OmpR family regulator
VKRILILDNDIDQISYYKSLLGKLYKVESVNKLFDLERHRDQIDEVDCLIADIYLIDGNFVDWLDQVNPRITEMIPVIVASSEDDLNILRKSYDLGIAEYLIKPFNTNDLLIKLERIFTNKNGNMSSGQVLFENLTVIENKIFSVLLKYQGETVERDDLYKLIWKNVQVSPKTLDVHLSNLRKKTNETPWLIENAGSGWKLIKKTLVQS